MNKSILKPLLKEVADPADFDFEMHHDVGICGVVFRVFCEYKWLGLHPRTTNFVSKEYQCSDCKEKKFVKHLNDWSFLFEESPKFVRIEKISHKFVEYSVAEIKSGNDFAKTILSSLNNFFEEKNKGSIKCQECYKKEFEVELDIQSIPNKRGNKTKFKPRVMDELVFMNWLRDPLGKEAIWHPNA